MSAGLDTDNPTASAQDGMTEVWFQNLCGHLHGVFPIDDKWRRIFLNQLHLLWIKAVPKPEDPNWHKLRVLLIEQNARIADLEAALATAKEALEAARAEILQSYRTYVMDDCDAVLPPGRKPAYDKVIDTIAEINALPPIKKAKP